MKKRFLALVLSCILGFSLCSMNTEAASAADKKAAKAAYTKLVQKSKKKSPYPDSVVYKMVDINGDKIPELLLTEGSISGTVSVYTYQPKKKKVKKLKSIQTGRAPANIYYKPKKHMFCMIQGTTQDAVFKMYSYRKQKCKLTFTMKYIFKPGQKGQYYYNGKKISLKTGNKKAKIIYKTFKSVRKN